MPDQPWTAAQLVAIDLEGTGAQDRQDEQILEIAAVPLAGGSPDMAAAWDSIINPGRPIAPRPWISPGLSGTALADAPTLSEVSGVIAEKLAGRILVGHNVGVDWRLIHRRMPHIEPAGLLDTARLARHVRPGIKRWNLTSMLSEYRLEGRVAELVPDGRPHRALWDAVGAALLLTELAARLPGKPGGASLATLLRVAGLEMVEPEQQSLLDL